MTGVDRLAMFSKKKSVAMAGEFAENESKKRPSEGTTLGSCWIRKGRPKRRWKEELDCDMITRGLQMLDIVAMHIYPPVTGHRQTLSIGRFAHL